MSKGLPSFMVVTEYVHAPSGVKFFERELQAKAWFGDGYLKANHKSKQLLELYHNPDAENPRTYIVRAFVEREPTK